MLEIHGRRVDPSAIRRTMLLTVEGERDDICSIGQTMAAHDLCLGQAPTSSTTTCSPAWGTTGCSAAGGGRPRSTPWMRSLIAARE